MELGLSLGSRGVLESNNTKNTKNKSKNEKNKIGGFCMGLGRSTAEIKLRGDDQGVEDEDDHNHNSERREKVGSSSSSEDPSTAAALPRLQLDLLPYSPLPRPPLRFPWLTDNLSPEPGSSDGPGSRTMEANRRRGAEEAEEQSSPNSGTSSLMEFSLYTSSTANNSGRRENGENNNDNEKGERGMGGAGMGGVGERVGVAAAAAAAAAATNSRGSDDDENGSSARKKLRLSKEQSAFLEDNFKEHHTLNPKQKLELAKQLNLRPRQVEVWFQNRRARTKLKQTEVDCEYLKRCCETLTEENRRLQKELQELRALKTSQPFFMHLPATTLTMCPSCERVVPTSSAAGTPAATGAATGSVTESSITLSLGKPKAMLR